MGCQALLPSRPPFASHVEHRLPSSNGDVAVRAREPVMPAPSSSAPTIGDALRHLTTYNATAATRTTVELTRAAGNLLLDAVTHPRTPLATAARGALWWSTMLDRRKPCWHRANTITMSTPFAHLRDFTA